MRLSRQILYLTLGSALLSMLVASIYFSIGLREAFVQQKLISLDNQLALRVQHFVDEIDQLRDTVRLLRRDDITLQWLRSGAARPELETLISAEYHNHLQTWPHYFQIRLLSLEGKELLRLDRDARGIFQVASEHLQDKSERYYFKAAKNLSAEEIWLSPLDLNRENGEISQPETPTVRAVSLITDTNAKVLGILVINLDAGSFLDELRMAASDSIILVVNRQGDFLIHPNAEYRFASDKGHAHRLATDYPRLNYELGFSGVNARHKIELNQQNYLFRSQEIPYDTLNPANNIRIIHLYPESTLVKSTNSALYRYLGYAFWLFLGITLFTLVISKRFTRRFQRLNTLVSQAGSDNKPEFVVHKPQDEIDEILLNFKSMLEAIADREHALIANEKQLAEYSEKLKRSNKDLENFAYMASHDLQEPARKVESFSSLLLMSEAKNLSEEGRELLQRNMRSASRMRELINAVLALSRVERLPLPQIEQELKPILDEALEDLQSLIEKRRPKIQVEQLGFVRGDRTQLKQLFINMVANAIKFVEQDIQPVVIIKPWTSETADEEVTLTRGFIIEDNGIGIAHEDRKRIFTPFERVNKGRFEGFGLGLAMCQRIVEMHEGKIEIENIEPCGSRFIVMFPS